MIAMSEPKINIIFGLITSLGQGTLMPVFGIILMKLTFRLNFNEGEEKLRENADFYCLMIFIIALLSSGFGFI